MDNNNGNKYSVVKYLNLYIAGKIDEAEKYRLAYIPDRLIKFYSLGNRKLDNKKLKSLENQQIWFSSSRYLNDPYEFEFMYIDKSQLIDRGYPKELLDYFSNYKDKYSVTSLSNSTVNNLPMWAYYTNNYKGYCVEYEVCDSTRIYKVSYEPERSKVTNIFGKYINDVSNLFENKDKKTDTRIPDTFSQLFFHQFLTKHISWSHENEYRIVMNIKNGGNVPILDLGLKTKRIIAGLNCSEAHKERLNNISHKLSCGDLLCTRISDNDYTLLEDYNG